MAYKKQQATIQSCKNAAKFFAPHAPYVLPTVSAPALSVSTQIIDGDALLDELLLMQVHIINKHVCPGLTIVMAFMDELKDLWNSYVNSGILTFQA